MRLFPLLATPLLAACAASGMQVPAVQLGPQPVRHAIQLDAALRDCLARSLSGGTTPVLRLYLESIHATQARSLKGVRVLLGPADAELSDAPDGAHALGAFVLGLSAGESQVWNLGPLLMKQWSAGERAWSQHGSLQLRLLPEPWEGMQLDAAFRLDIGRVRVEASGCAAG